MLGDRLAGNRNYYMANNLIRPQNPDLAQDSTLNIRMNTNHLMFLIIPEFSFFWMDCLQSTVYNRSIVYIHTSKFLTVFVSVIIN